MDGRRGAGASRTIPGVRVLVACSLGGAGHFNPLSPFLAAAARGMHEPLVVGPPALRELVEEAGYPFAPGAQPSSTEVAGLRSELPSGLRHESTVLGSRESFTALATRAMLPAMQVVVDTFRPDLVLREPWEYASAVVCHDRRMRMAQVAISTAEPEYGPVEAVSAALDGYRPVLAREVREAPYLSRLPASLDPSSFPRTLRYHADGAEPPAPRPLPDWWDGSRAPLVYMTFGAVLSSMSVARSVFGLAVEAVAGIDCRVLLTVGRGFDPGSLAGVPPNVHVERWVDQAAAFREAAVVVCHGGSGTVFGALAAGIPIVAVPLFADQFENAWLVARSGAGVAVEGEPSGDAAPGERRVIGAGGAPRLAHAVREVLDGSGYRDSAARLAAEMAATPTAGEVLEQLLAEA